VDLTGPEKQFMLPTCFNASGFFEKYPPAVADVENSTILNMGAESRGNQLVRDTAAVIRLLETALVLNDEKDCSAAELEKLKARNEKLVA
ncbi:hypothetical protein A2U01_0080544, partial [Trifolium medium]|nr:hypothetical protein [Trifolium medium]